MNEAAQVVSVKSATLDDVLPLLEGSPTLPTLTPAALRALAERVKGYTRR